jgi:hypothetical protein
MTDVLAMSEQAGVLAGNIGGYLFDRGSTAGIKNLGSDIVRTAGSLMAEVRARRTRKAAPAASAAGSALRLPAGVSATTRQAKSRAAGGAPVASAAGSVLFSPEERAAPTPEARSRVRNWGRSAASPAAAVMRPLALPSAAAAGPLKRTVSGVLRPLPTITGELPAPANIARGAQNAALKAAAEQVKAAAAKPGILRKAAEVVGLRKPAAAPSPFAPRLPLSSLVEEEPEENAEEEEVPAGSPAAAASRMAGLFGAADTLPGAAATLNAAKAALVKKGQKGGKRRTRKARKH